MTTFEIPQINVQSFPTPELWIPRNRAGNPPEPPIGPLPGILDDETGGNILDDETGARILPDDESATPGGGAAILDDESSTPISDDETSGLITPDE